MSQALAEAARLRPHIRLAQAISEFSASLDPERRTSFKNLQSQSPPTAASVIKLTEEINLQGSRSHRAWRPYATRLVVLLERTIVFARAGDMLLGSSRNTISSGVWAVLRFSLEDATRFLSFFQQISELFMRIGATADFQQNFATLFPNCKELHEYMCEYLIVVLEICRKIVAFGKKPLFKQISSSQTLDADFKTLEAELQHWTVRIDHKSRALLASSNINTENMVGTVVKSFALFSSDESRRDAVEEKRLRLLSRLCPNQSRFEPAWRRERKKGIVKWVFEIPAYLQWEASGVTSLLWITGKLGSGKTVLMANLVARLGCHQGHPLFASFFCRYDDADTMTSETILGSLAHQLVQELDSKEAAYLVQRYGTDSLGGLDTMTKIGPLLPRGKLIYVVIDALDECQPSEAAAVLDGLKKLSETTTLRVCCSSRPGTSETLRQEGWRLFEHHSSITLGGESFAKELDDYINAEIEIRKGARDLPQKIRKLLQSTLAAAANGMYLWVSLQIDLLFPRSSQAYTSDSDIINILNSLPGDLQALFDRVLDTIKNPVQGVKLFKLTAAAGRPLQIDELRVALNVEPGELDWRPEGLIRTYNATAAVASLSGGLVEVDEEDGGVRYIHHSALQYLSTTDEHRQRSGPLSVYGFTPAQAEGLMADVCVTYLSLGIHNRSPVETSKSLDSNELLENIQSSAAKNADIPGKLVAAFLKTRKVQPATSPLDLLQMLQAELRAYCVQEDNPMVFLDYARKNFIKHTSQLSTPLHETSGPLLLGLIADTPPHVNDKDWKQPDEKGNEILWAARTSHERAFVLLSESPQLTTAAVQELMSRARQESPLFTLRGAALGSIVGHCVDVMPFCSNSPLDDLKALGSILDRGADPNVPYQPRLYGYGTEGKVKPLFSVMFLGLKKSIGSRAWPWTWLEPATKKLLDCGALPDLDDVFYAISHYNKRQEPLELLLNRRQFLANTASHGVTPVSHAIDVLGDDAAGAIETLRNFQADLDASYKRSDGTWTTPLIEAITRQHKSIVRYLLACRVRVDYVWEGTTPLLAAIDQCRDLVSEISKAADVEFPAPGPRSSGNRILYPLAKSIEADDGDLVIDLLAAKGSEVWQRAFGRSVRSRKLEVLERICGQLNSMGLSDVIHYLWDRSWVFEIIGETSDPLVIRCLNKHHVRLWHSGFPAGQQPFVIALRRRHFSVAEALLRCDIPLTFRNSDKWEETRVLAEKAGILQLGSKELRDLWYKVLHSKHDNA